MVERCKTGQHLFMLKMPRNLQQRTHRKVWYLIIRLLFPHDGVQQVAIVSKGCDPEYPTYIL